MKAAVMFILGACLGAALVGSKWYYEYTAEAAYPEEAAAALAAYGMSDYAILVAALEAAEADSGLGFLVRDALTLAAPQLEANMAQLMADTYSAAELLDLARLHCKHPELLEKTLRASNEVNEIVEDALASEPVQQLLKERLVTPDEAASLQETARDAVYAVVDL